MPWFYLTMCLNSFGGNFCFTWSSRNRRSHLTAEFNFSSWEGSANSNGRSKLSLIIDINFTNGTMLSQEMIKKTTWSNKTTPFWKMKNLMDGCRDSIRTKTRKMNVEFFDWITSSGIGVISVVLLGKLRKVFKL